MTGSGGEETVTAVDGEEETVVLCNSERAMNRPMTATARMVMRRLTRKGMTRKGMATEGAIASSVTVMLVLVFATAVMVVTTLMGQGMARVIKAVVERIV